MESEHNNCLAERVRGFLDAFALFNTKTNHGYSFEFVVLDKQQSLERVVYEYLDDLAGIRADTLKITRVENAKEELQKSLSRWLFKFLPENDKHYHLTDQNKHFTLSNSEWRLQAVAELVELISTVVKPIAVHKVDFQNIQWYEMDWEDFALEGQQHIFILHLGVSD